MMYWRAHKLSAVFKCNNVQHIDADSFEILLVNIGISESIGASEYTLAPQETRSCALLFLSSLHRSLSRLRVSLQSGALASWWKSRLGRRWMSAMLLLLWMLESSSRLAPSNQAMPMVSSATLEAWCSTFIAVSCSSLIATTIGCKYSRVMTDARSCTSSAREVSNQASSSGRTASRSITITIASSSAIPAIIEYSYGH